MKVDCLVLGSFETNCYVLHSVSIAGKCVIIDTGLDTQGIVEYLSANNLTPEAIVLTHGHADHIAGIAAVKERYPEVKLYVHSDDADMLTDAQVNLSVITGTAFEAPPADVLVKDNDIIEEAGINMLVLHTPGHTPGGICLYIHSENMLFAGDTLFAGSVGRTDFPGGNMPQLMESIQKKILPLPDETVVYSGHGPSTKIGREKKFNPYMK